MVRSKELNTHYDYGKSEVFCKREDEVSDNRPKILAFASRLIRLCQLYLLFHFSEAE